MTFKTIGDYFILLAYCLTKLHEPVLAQRLIEDFEQAVACYRQAVNADVVAKAVEPDLTQRIALVKEFYMAIDL